MERTKKSEEEIIENSIKSIAENYQKLEEDIVNQLNFHCEHGTTIGTFREEIWKSLFERIVPKKFAIERSVFIIDSNGMISKEVDLVIFDEQYTPYIFKYSQLKFIPIEAVAIVVECKSKDPDKNDLKAWVERIDCLETSLNSIVRQASHITKGVSKKELEEKREKGVIDVSVKEKRTQTSTRPLKILCCTSMAAKEKLLDEIFDIIICAPAQSDKEKKSKQKIEIKFSDSNKDLKDWFQSLNHSKDTFKEYNNQEGNYLEKISLDEYKVYIDGEENNQSEITLLSFIFQLNQILMLINNPIFFPHREYVNMFNRILGGKQDG